jgi:helix-turn-helix protein
VPATTRAPKAMALTSYNSQAGAQLRQARHRAGMDQLAMSWALSYLLGFEVSTSSLAYYESGTNTVPAAVLLAALELAESRRRARIAAPMEGRRVSSKRSHRETTSEVLNGPRM